MKKNIFLLITIMIIMIFLSGCTENKDSNDNTENNEYMTAMEVYQDRGIIQGDPTNIVVDFSSFNEGDTLVLRDKIDEIEYVTWDSSTQYTQITFNINDWLGLSYCFEEDLTNKYKVNDTIEITFTIKNYVYQKESSISDDIINYDVEIPLEGFDSEYYEENERVLMPSSCIKKI